MECNKYADDDFHKKNTSFRPSHLTHTSIKITILLLEEESILRKKEMWHSGSSHSHRSKNGRAKSMIADQLTMA
jgi:hypothetical protein